MKFIIALALQNATCDEFEITKISILNKIPLKQSMDYDLFFLFESRHKCQRINKPKQVMHLYELY